MRTISEAIIARPTTEPFEVQATAQATVLGAAFTNGVLFIAFLAEQGEATERRGFALLNPGADVPDALTFVCPVHDPPFMQHLFEVTP